MKSAPAIAFDYRPSRRLVLALVVVFALAVTSLWLSGMPWWSKLTLMLGATWYALASWRRMIRNAPRRIAWQAEGHWNLRDRKGREYVAMLKTAVVRGGWVFLNLWSGETGQVRIVLAPDNCDADTRRRLRVRLASRSDGSPDGVVP